MTEPLSVLLVDDEERFRQGLCNLLAFYCNSTSLSVEVIGEADCVEKALKLTAQKLYFSSDAERCRRLSF